MTQMEDKKTIANSTVLLNLQLSCPGIRKRIGTETVLDTNADKAMLSVYKDIMESGELQRIKAFDSSVRMWLKKRCLPSQYKNGIYLMPLNLVMETDKKLQAWDDERAILVEQFMEAYPSLITGAELRLRDMFNPLDYPTAKALEAKFNMQYSYLTFDTPSSLKGIRAELFQREAAKAEQMLVAQTEKIQMALRTQFYEVVHAMELALTPKEDGKPRRFSTSTVDNYKEFCKYFRERNITDDAELMELVEKSEKMLEHSDPELIKLSQTTKEHVSYEVKTISEKLAAMTVAQGRMLDLDGDV